MTMVGGREIVMPEGAVQGLRLLNNNNNKNNNNRNNNNNNNNNNAYNNYNGYSSYDPFNPVLFGGTFAFCLATLLFMIVRIKCIRRKQEKRRRLGKSRRSRKSKKDDDEDSVITDEEIHRYVLPSKKELSMQEAAKVVRCDKETSRIMDICNPYFLHSAVSAACSVANTALVGKVLGVDALAIYFIASVPPAFTGTIIDSVLSTVSSLGGQSVGVGSFKLTGQYCQISIFLYTLLFIPHVILWAVYLKPALHWFAPDLSYETIEEGYNYFMIGLIGSYASALSTVLHSLLEVMDQYNYSMLSSVAGEVAVVLGFISYLEINDGGQKTIVWLSAIYSIQQVLFLLIDFTVSKRKKWFDDVWKGIFHSVAIKNWEAVWRVLKTAAPMSLGNTILTVEWELLSVFAAGLGENYLAAWGIVGTIWGILEYVTECVASAGEIRVAKLLGNGNARQAKLSAYKCLFLGNFFATLISIGFLFGMHHIPALFTDDEFLQILISNVLPYCVLGNFTLTMGTIAWTLVGASGRYGLATFNGCLGSIFVTIPAAILATNTFNLGLPGLAAAVVIGYMVSSALNSMELFSTDWEYISYRVMIRNGATAYAEEEEEEEGEDQSGMWGMFGLVNNAIQETFSNEGDSNVDYSMSGGRGWTDYEADRSEESEVREIIIGPGKLGFTIQSTERGPTIVGIDTVRSSGSFFGMFGGRSDGDRAKVYQGEFYLGDVIIEVNGTRTSRMSGRQLAMMLYHLKDHPQRTIMVSHREGAEITVYQPGPYGSALIANVMENEKGMNRRGTEKAANGAGYWLFS